MRIVRRWAVWHGREPLVCVLRAVQCWELRHGRKHSPQLHGPLRRWEIWRWRGIGQLVHWALCGGVLRHWWLLCSHMQRPLHVPSGLLLARYGFVQPQSVQQRVKLCCLPRRLLLRRRRGPADPMYTRLLQHRRAGGVHQLRCGQVQSRVAYVPIKGCVRRVGLRHLYRCLRATAAENILWWVSC